MPQISIFVFFFFLLREAKCIKIITEISVCCKQLLFYISSHQNCSQEYLIFDNLISGNASSLIWLYTESLHFLLAIQAPQLLLVSVAPVKKIHGSHFNKPFKLGERIAQLKHKFSFMPNGHHCVENAKEIAYLLHNPFRR